MRYVTFFTLVCVILTFQFLPAQAPDTLWTKTYSGAGYCVVEASDGGLIIVGGKNGEIYMLKTNSAGDSLWSKKYGPGGGYYVSKTINNGFVIVGLCGLYSHDCPLIRTNSLGDTLWTDIIEDCVGYCVQSTINSSLYDGYIICGHYGVDHPWLAFRWWNGGIAWSHTYGGPGGLGLFNYAQQTSDFGFLAVGGYSMLGKIATKTDINGFIEWTKSYGLHGTLDCFVEESDGYMILASSGDGTSFIRTDFSGDTLWTKFIELPRPSGHVIVNKSITKTHNGSYLIAAYSAPDVPGYEPGGKGYIILANESGDTLWTKVYSDSIDRVLINSAVQTSDYGYLVAGTHKGLFLVKFAPSTTDIKKSNNIITQSFSLSQNYPNPFNPTTTIEFDLPKTSEVSLKVYNIIGEEVAILVSDRLSAGSYSYEWDAGNLASGVYLYRLQSGDYIETRKMVLMR